MYKLKGSGYHVRSLSAIQLLDLGGYTCASWDACVEKVSRGSLQS